MKKKIFDIVLWIITLFFIGGVFLMPETVPIHWDINWKVDGYGSRYSLIILALFPILVHYGMFFAKKIDPRKRNIEKREKTYEIFRYGLTCFFIVLVVIFYYLTLNPQGNIKVILLSVLGLLLIGMGNYMPKVPQNYFLGIKTPWTLANEYVWKKTHKLGGYSYIVVGLIILINALLDLPYEYIVIMVLLIGDVILCYGYSYFVIRKIDTKNIDL